MIVHKQDTDYIIGHMSEEVRDRIGCASSETVTNLIVFNEGDSKSMCLKNMRTTNRLAFLQVKLNWPFYISYNCI